MNISFHQLVMPPEATPSRYLNSINFVMYTVHAHSFSQCTVNPWNELRIELVISPALSVFKGQSDSFYSNIFIIHRYCNCISKDLELYRLQPSLYFL